MEGERLFFRIGDVAERVGVKAYVLRYWETEFPILAPEKSTTGQRVYRRTDVETLMMIKHLLYTERYSIEGARRRIRELRKSGELKKYRAEAISLAPQAVVPVEDSHESDDTSTPTRSRDETLRRAREISAELKALAEAPLSGIFRL